MDTKMSRLSPRAQEIMALMAKGLTNAEIADVLGLSLSTVKGHVERILKRLEVSNRTEAVWSYYASGDQDGTA